ncbi:MAG: CopG family antitoxin [Caldilineaceae bacterium]
MAENNHNHKADNTIPEEFDSYEEAAEFWEIHDTAEYSDTFVPVNIQAEFRQRHYEIELDKDIVIALNQLATKRGIAIRELANELLREQLVAV